MMHVPMTLGFTRVFGGGQTGKGTLLSILTDGWEIVQLEKTNLLSGSSEAACGVSPFIVRVAVLQARTGSSYSGFQTGILELGVTMRSSSSNLHLWHIILLEKGSASLVQL